MTGFMVVGAGAIGCWAGGMLALAGARPMLVGRARIVEALRAGGLRVGDLDGLDAQVTPDRFEVAQSVADAAASIPPAQRSDVIVLLCVKGGATREAAREIAAVLPAGTPVVSLQNGVDNVARIREAAPALDAAAGMVPFNVIMPRPDAVYRATTGMLHLQDTTAARTLAQALQAAGVPSRLHADMAGVQWGKLLLNLNNPVNALSDLPLRDQLLDRGLRRALALLQDEALAALRAARIVPAKVAAAPPARLPAILRLPTPLFKMVARRMLHIDPAARSSMWDDVQAGRATEVDDLCGAVVRLGEAHGVPTPANRRMLGLVAGHVRGRQWSGDRLLAALRAPD